MESIGAEVVAVVPEQVSLPEQLLVDRGLGKSAKLLWAFRHLGLRRVQSGLCRDTWRAATAQLRAACWLSRARSGPCASIPTDLLLDRGVGTQAKLLYALLQFTPGFSRNSGQFTFTQLCQRTYVSRNALKEAVRQLVGAGWLAINRTSKFAPICFTRNRSAFRVREKEVAQAFWEYRQAPSKGEGLMQAFLSAVVASGDFIRNARPGFLINPETGYELELDRYYPPHPGPGGAPVGAVAFEYQGLQHDQTTEWFPSPAVLRKQQGRDRSKAEICAERGIQLILVRDEDLTLERMRRKVVGLLPLRNLDGNPQLVRALERLRRKYRGGAALPLPTPLRKSS